MRGMIMFLTAVTLATQAAAQSTPRTPGSQAPAGWQVRLDRADAPTAEVKFTTMGSGYHVTLGPSAVFYNPAQTADGEYRARATFTQTRPSQHPEGYGLIVGGRDLGSPKQDYLYFLVRQDGKFLVKHRAGQETHTLHDWTEHSAIARADSSGKMTNTLAIDAGAHGARFLVNGTEVAKIDRVPYLNTDGIVGLRINHNLDVHIDKFSVERGGAR
jgi:hypothetical protein